MQCDICRQVGEEIKGTPFTFCLRCWGQVKAGKYYAYKSKVYNRSKVQGQVRMALKKFVAPVFEEVYFPWARSTETNALLPFDFYVPSLELVVEVQGGEHYEFTPIFHRTRQDFIRRQLVDHIKEGAAEDNDLNYLAIDGRQPITSARIGEILKDYVKTAKFRRSVSTGPKRGQPRCADMD
jgi:hypothetical protein